MSILEQFSDYAILVIDTNSFVVYANSGLTNVFGWAPKELVGKRITELMPDSYRKMHILGMDRYILSGVRGINWKSSNLQGLRKDGTVIPIEISFGEFEKDCDLFFVGMICDTSNGNSLKQHLNPALVENIVKEIYTEWR